MRVLVTRPEPEGERTVEKLRALGHEAWLVPLLRIEVVDADFGAGPWEAVLFTSANAVRAIAVHRRFAALAGLPAYTVGARTRAAAAAVGFSPVASADGDVGDLVALVAAQLASPTKPLIYLAGDHRAGDIASALRSKGLRIETAVVYRAVMVENLPPPVESLLAQGRFDAVLHYSPRSSAAFVAALSAAGIGDLSIKIKHLCLSSEVAAPLLAAGARMVEVAGEPTENALLERLGTA
jgi:uroporphyrinogen-III synthase